MYTIDGIDIHKGLEKYDNNEDVYFKILSSYTANLHTISDALHAMGTVDKQNLAEYKLRMHSIKGTSLDIYATDIGNRAAQFEQMAKDGNIEGINKDIQEYLNTIEKLLEDLDTLLHEIITSKPKPVKDSPDKVLLAQLREACDNYSMDGVNDAMDEIEQYIYDSDGGLAVWLREQVNVMAFGQITERLSDI